MDKYRLVAIEPKKEPYEALMSFDEIQAFVGGYVEQFVLFENMMALFNETGKMKNLPLNRNIILEDQHTSPLKILGNFVVVKLNPNTGAYESLTDREVQDVKQKYTWID